MAGGVPVHCGAVGRRPWLSELTFLFSEHALRSLDVSLERVATDQPSQRVPGYRVQPRTDWPGSNVLHQCERSADLRAPVAAPAVFFKATPGCVCCGRLVVCGSDTERDGRCLFRWSAAQGLCHFSDLTHDWADAVVPVEYRAIARHCRRFTQACDPTCPRRRTIRHLGSSSFTPGIERQGVKSRCLRHIAAD